MSGFLLATCIPGVQLAETEAARFAGRASALTEGRNYRVVRNAINTHINVIAPATRYGAPGR